MGLRSDCRLFLTERMQRLGMHMIAVRAGRSALAATPTSPLGNRTGTSMPWDDPPLASTHFKSALNLSAEDGCYMKYLKLAESSKRENHLKTRKPS